jgi:two-component system nitrate/nitrite response regulator NarL
VALFSVSPDRGTAPVRVAVVAELGLVAESVRAALMARGYDVVVVRWPAPDDLSSPPRRRPRRRVGPPPDVALLLSDLSRTTVVRAARSFVSSLDLPWLVLTGASRGPAWGALYDSGAALVVSADTRLDATCDLITELAAGRTPASERRRRHELISAWHSFAQQRDELTARLESLTDREVAVLSQLYSGLSVRMIAERGEVTESTVRSQVKSILRKLEVKSQLAAVAAYGDAIADSPYADVGGS